MVERVTVTNHCPKCNKELNVLYGDKVQCSCGSFSHINDLVPKITYGSKTEHVLNEKEKKIRKQTLLEVREFLIEKAEDAMKKCYLDYDVDESRLLSYAYSNAANEIHQWVKKEES